MSGGEFAEIEARAAAVADAFHDDVPLELDTYVWKYAPGQQKWFTSIHGEQGDIAAIEGWNDDATATIEALISAVNVARTDIPALLAAVRERDNTIARVRAELARHDEYLPAAVNYDCCGFCNFTTGSYIAWPCRPTYVHLRAALDPQETE